MSHTKLGRIHHPDPRDHNYLLPHNASVALAQPTLTHKLWTINAQHLDQGDTGTCVGHGWRNFLRCAPIQTSAKSPSAFDIYRGAVLLDPWPENDGEAKLPDNSSGMDSGTTVRAGAKALQNLGRLASYAWAFSLTPAVNWVLTKGPVVLGTDWHEDMFSPNSKGVVDIGGEIAGGHCYLLRGVDTKTRMARCTNSWGNSWNPVLKGDFLIDFDSLDALIRVGGEVCTAIQSI